MSKPIPVFVFALAAYAATSGGGSSAARREPPDVQDAADLFAASYRLMSRRNAGGLIVKIALAGGAEAGEFCWLGEIVETAQGFQGRVVIAPSRRRRARRGQRLDFGSDQVLGWSVSMKAPRRRAVLAELVRHAGPETA